MGLREDNKMELCGGQEQGNSHHYHDDYHDNGGNDVKCCTLSQSENDYEDGYPFPGIVSGACPLRRGIRCRNNEVDNMDHYNCGNEMSCELNLRSNWPSNICHCTSSSSNIDDTPSKFNEINESRRNSNYLSVPKRNLVWRRRRKGDHGDSLSSSKFSSTFRIGSLYSFLLRPCAFYLLTLILILDLSDFRSVIVIRSERTMRLSADQTHHGFLVNAMQSKNGHLSFNGLGGLTGAETPILSMDSVSFDHSIGNELTGSSSEEEQGEKYSEEMLEEDGEDEEDSVEISRTVEPQQLKRLESKFLNLFGMEKRPQRQGNKKNIKVPKYLLDLYEKQSGAGVPTSNLNLPGRHTRTANTVRTFYHQTDPKKTPEYPWKGRENHITFSLDSIPSDESVTGAELRIPFVITVSYENSVMVNSAPLVEANKVGGVGELRAVRILLHDIMKPATSPLSKKPKEHHLLEPITYPIDTKTVVLSKRRNGTSSFWLTFDVFPAVHRWMNNPKKNYGLVLEILGLTNEGLTVPQEIVLQKHNLRVKRDAPAQEENYGEDRSSSGTSVSSASNISPESSSSTAKTPLSSAFIKGSSPPSIEDSGEETSTVSAPLPKSPTEVGVAQSNDKRKGKRRAKSVDTLSSSIVLFTYSDDGHNPTGRDAKTLSRNYRSAQAQRRRKNHRNKNRKRNLCQRHAMFVDFQDVGWNDWIVAPPGYAAYYCSGECPFPMAEHLNATNHAVIQALVHSMNPALVPPPCCVPTKYSSLSLLYTDSSDKIVLKNYNEMVVDSCGCS